MQVAVFTMALLSLGILTTRTVQFFARPYPAIAFKPTIAKIQMNSVEIVLTVHITLYTL